jgi:hypothetical protein
VHRAWDAGDPDLLDGLLSTDDLGQDPFTRPNPMRRYLNLRGWWDEPANILYFKPGVQLFYNLDDHSYSIAPELNYSGFDDFVLRLRVTVPVGNALTEWGEKASDYQVELRLRYYF